MDETPLKEVSEALPSNLSDSEHGTLGDPPSEFTTRSTMALLGCMGAVFCTVGFLNAFGVFETYYATNILSNESDSNIGWIGALNIFLLFAGSLITGRILDLFGPAVMFWVGSIITVFAIMMVSLCKTFWEFILAQGIVLGVGETLLLCPAVALVGQHFKKRLSIALGITIAGSSLGGVVWPVVMHSLLDSPSIGFGWSMRIAGFIMLPILAVSSMIARPPIEAKNSTTAAKPSKPAWDWSLVTKPAMALTASAFFFVYFGMFMPFFYTTDYALAQGFSSNLSFYTISLVNGASLFGRILPGFVADKYGRFNLCIIMITFSGIIAMCMTTVTTVAGLVFFSLAYGFSSGRTFVQGILSLQQGCAAKLATPTTVGTAIGFVMASTSLS
ncbi:hypothetical protein UA08_02155 [Talaromyces atroroseus]|uniref:Major facilitator superfamily (MFS) profile domain-containing protein n=1 Tax=Talaromyces atroroseus TaxID=1441469 RepID=A0A225B3F2_TALAT|nr:hypothetical protein UA08_02155 [Talaromyces atroroseus]OKL62539.1 hypothetical protein UA08_02155 [Talaromyces atroroseus]